ncbi:MAG TPA: hypothetical protein VNH11_11990 [Pirellulales bacterium]|nr:hypothetical protein [Pirellulales bacterium]
MTIVWEETALDELTDAWLSANSAERQQITAATLPTTPANTTTPATIAI